MEYDLLLTTASLLVLAACAAWGVFHADFDDTLCQRICLAGICLGSLGTARWVWDMGYHAGPLAWLTAMLAAYALETARKIMRKVETARKIMRKGQSCN